MESTVPKQAPSEISGGAETQAVDIAGKTVTLGAAAGSVAALPEAFERYPQGGNVVAGLLIFAMICWVIVTWLKHRRS